MQRKGITYLQHRCLVYKLDLGQKLSRGPKSMEFIEVKIYKKSLFNFIEFQTYDSPQNKFKKQYFFQFTTQPNKSFERRTKIKQISKTKIKITKSRGHIIGRNIIDIYRICQADLKLKSYSFENVCKHFFKLKYPKFNDETLWNMSLDAKTQTKFINYFLIRLQFYIEICQKINIITFTVQKSKLYGSDFKSMMERGTQFKIQAILSRIAKENQFLLISPSRTQVATKSFLECRALTLQPPKLFFVEQVVLISPVVVLDFQSLYPSVMIAYNICYSTCLGSLKQMINRFGQKKLGVKQYLVPEMNLIKEILQNQQLTELQKMHALSKYVFITPNKVIFLKKCIYQGLIPKILLQFLVSRVMIKNSSKIYKGYLLKNILNSRQLAIKLFMNTMYGYTGATFTGRMPCAQIADSVVQTSKFLLKTCIDYVVNIYNQNSKKQLKAKVVYGDTDSMFIHLKGRSIKEAFKIGKSLQKQLSLFFPAPVQMKFEKVYNGLFLISKKRYGGLKLQKQGEQGEVQVKGLQSIRRDGCNIISNLMKDCLEIILKTKDLSILRGHLLKNVNQICNIEKSIKDYCYQKSVKLAKYSQKSIPAHGIAGIQLSKIQQMLVPKYGQRIKYLICKNSNSKKIKEKVIPLHSLESLTLIDTEYIINAIKKCLNRLLCTCDFDVKSLLIFKYGKFKNSMALCKLCQSFGKGVCSKCKNGQSMSQILQKIDCEKNFYQKVCLECQKSCILNKCYNTDCEIYFKNFQLIHSKQARLNNKIKIVLETNP